MKIVGLIPVFVFKSWFLAAQYEGILHDPAVTWAAEIDVVYVLQRPMPADSIQQNDITYWKNYDPHNLVPMDNGELLIEKILTAARTGAWPAWLLGDSTRQLSADDVIRQLGRRDTIEVMDVGTGITHQKVVTNDPDPASFFGIRAKQLLFYDAKKGEFELYTWAIAPVCHFSTMTQTSRYDWQDVYLFDYVPFWLKMPEFSKKEEKKRPNLNNPKIHWAAQIKTLDNTPDMDKMHTVKNTDPFVMQHLLDRFLTDPTYKAADGLGAPIDFADREALLFRADTVILFDPETYEEYSKVVHNDITSVEAHYLQLTENWFWDDRRQRLSIRLSSFAPMMDEKDNDGNFRYKRGVFYVTKK